MHALPRFYLSGILLICMSSIFLLPQISLSQPLIEICDNGIDDDNDGLIDLNDSDCDCPYIEPMTIIPNPSFEESICCPVESGKMSCVDNWVQSTATTTDYINRCGFNGFSSVPPPLPYPDGNACIGFFNGFADITDKRPYWKEFFGTCFDVPLLAGITYTFEYYVGFVEPPYNPGIYLTFYGSKNCERLPLPNPPEDLGCPANDQNWKVIGDSYVEGQNEWIRQQMIITPDEDIYGIMIGPDCKDYDRDNSAYYYFDHLSLVAQTEFEFDIRTSGLPCSEDFKLSVAKVDIFQYQWFKDGIALNGETDASLIGQFGEGIYQVMITGDHIGCRVSKEYLHELPISYGNILQTICTGESFQFNNQNLDSAGTYFDTLKTSENCDSILSMELAIVDDFRTSVSAKIFPRESYHIGNQSFQQIGQYEVLLTSKAGCDSLVYLDLDHYDLFIPTAFTPNGDGINDVFTVIGGDDLILIKDITVFNRWGKIIFSGNNFKANDLNDGWNGRSQSNAVPEGVYVFLASLIYDDGNERVVTGSITLIR